MNMFYDFPWPSGNAGNKSGCYCLPQDSVTAFYDVLDMVMGGEKHVSVWYYDKVYYVKYKAGLNFALCCEMCMTRKNTRSNNAHRKICYSLNEQ